MKYNRRSIRIKNYDYNQSGMYFITVCVKPKYNLFGDIKNRKMILNIYGKIAKEEWIKSHTIRKNIFIDHFVIMPDHVHGIIIVKNEGRGTVHRAPTVYN